MGKKLFIEIDTAGKILRFSEALKCPESSTGSTWIEISEKAEFFLMENKIAFIYETESISYCPPGILRHNSEMKEEKAFFSPDSIFDFRIELFSKNWDRLKALVNPSGKNISGLVESIAAISNSPDASINDAVVMRWMLENEPCWRIVSLSSDVAALICNSRIEADLESAEIPSICLRASDGYLFANVKEILAFKDEDDTIVAVTYTLAKGFNMYFQSSVAEIMADKDLYRSLFDAILFIQKFLAIKECEKSPIEIEDREGAKLAKKGIKKVSGLFRFQASLSKRYAAIKRENHEAMDKEGKVLATVQVSGFVRNQAYGEGRALRKRIWVDGFTRGQWVRSGITYVTIKE